MTQKVAIGEASLRKVAGIILGLNPKVEWRIDIHRYQPRRTISQNKLYFAVLTAMAEETGSTKEEMHEAMKRKLLPTKILELGDEEIPVTASTAKMEKRAFSEYVEKVIAFAATELGIQV